MINLNAILRRIVYFVAKKFNLINSNYYRIDGGLGSQIICFLIYIQALRENKKIYCDVSFYHKTPDDIVFLTNTYRSWSLDSFGISLDSFSTKSDLSFFDRFKLKPDDSFFGTQFEKFLKNYNPEFANLIPNLGLETIILNNYKIDNSDYSVIHIRKGDFLKYSSYLIDDLSYLNLIISLKNVLTKNVFVVSDERLDSKLEYSIKEILINNVIIFEYSYPELEVHCLMRNAKILVTSNSMFSLSAALLRSNDLLTFIPKTFYSKDFDLYNKGINSLSEWNVI